MNVLFLTLLDFESIEERNIYTDLLREFVKHGHCVYAISPVEKKRKKKTHIVSERNTIVLKLRIGNIQKTSVIEKGISTIMLEPIFIHAIKQYFSDVKFDLILYSTPPISLVGAIEYAKKRDNAKTYLLLKDIFPQNAVDLGMLKTTGIKGLLYKHFRYQEKRLYNISDRIGCMSEANVKYVIKHNPEIDSNKVEVCPNSIEVKNTSVNYVTRKRIRAKYKIPNDKTVFIYGGNIGKPQGVPFIIECLEKCKDIKDAFFLVVGNGTEFGKLEAYKKHYKQNNFRLMNGLPKEDYDILVSSCDVGLIFLDHRFIIPNFPSRLLSYMQAKITVLACTDPNTDIGRIIIKEGFGWWCESNDSAKFCDLVKRIIGVSNKADMAENAMKCLENNYSVEKSYDIIMR